VTVDPPSLPDTSNLFGSLDSALPPERVANLFAYRGWQVRRCSWTDYEVTCEFAELVIEPSSSKSNCVLIHGAVADVVANLPRIVEPLASAEIPYFLECYDEKFELIHHARG
jgi:hypothetical protein